MDTIARFTDSECCSKLDNNTIFHEHHISSMKKSYMLHIGLTLIAWTIKEEIKLSSQIIKLF